MTKTRFFQLPIGCSFCFSCSCPHFMFYFSGYVYQCKHAQCYRRMKMEEAIVYTFKRDKKKNSFNNINIMSVKSSQGHIFFFFKLHRFLCWIYSSNAVYILFSSINLCTPSLFLYISRYFYTKTTLGRQWNA